MLLHSLEHHPRPAINPLPHLRLVIVVVVFLVFLLVHRKLLTPRIVQEQVLHQHGGLTRRGHSLVVHHRDGVQHRPGEFEVGFADPAKAGEGDDAVSYEGVDVGVDQGADGRGQSDRTAGWRNRG